MSNNQCKNIGDPTKCGTGCLGTIHRKNRRYERYLWTTKNGLGSHMALRAIAASACQSCVCLCDVCLVDDMEKIDEERCAQLLVAGANRVFSFEKKSCSVY